MSEYEPLQEKIQRMFVRESEELLEQLLDQMEGWFVFSGEEIFLGERLQQLGKGRRYLAYLLAAYVSHKGGLRATPYVDHREVNQHFGWTQGRTATQHASKYARYLIANGSRRKVAPGRIDEITRHIQQAL